MYYSFRFILSTYVNYLPVKLVSLGVPVRVMHVKEGKSKETPLDIFSYLNEIG